ncbi:MAG: hypothetical protein GF392_03145 [Candidatus Omnitrophica bacterium]|nr:hypothetical protein [Candidatus Omnitrophota bacterium]
MRYFHSYQYFDPDGEKHKWPNDGTGQSYDLELKNEFGLTDDLDLLLYVPYTWAYWQNDWSDTRFGQNEKHEGFKQVQPGFKYRFLKKPFTAAGQIKFFIDIPNTDRVQQPDIYEYGNAMEIRGLFGKSWRLYDRPAYASLETGVYWTFPNNDWAHYVPVFFETGFAPLEWLMVKTELDGRFSLQGTGIQKDTLTWRVGPIFSLLGRSFSTIKKGGESSLNVEFQYGMTVWGRGDGNTERYNNVSKAQEFIAKVQMLW